MNSSLTLTPQHKEQLAQWVSQGYPNETCGLILGTDQNGKVEVKEFTQARNLNTERAHDRFQLDPQDMKKADDLARQQKVDVVGIWHSHPDHPAEPSQTDLEAAWEGWSYIIAKVTAKGLEDLRSWRLEEGRFVEEKVSIIESVSGV